MFRKQHKLKQINSTIAGMIAAIGFTAPLSGWAQQATDLGTVGSTGTADGRASSTAPASRAAQVAPTQSSLKATQPQSIIPRSFIEDAKSPVTDFSGIAAIAPSMSLGISANGPGLGETKNTMRGFPDGQFNITWDGIPFGDTNGPTHHSTAYFPAAVIGRVEIERGPGNASNLGQATFGGSLNLFSRDLLKEQTVGTIFSYGSWNTKLVGVSYDSGFSKGGDALFGINVQHMSSDGYRTESGVNGDNIMMKYLKPLGDSTLMTINVNYQRNWYHLNDNERGLTLTEAAQFGKNFNLGNDPTKPNYKGYNLVHKSTTMDYLRLQTDWGSGWATDNTLYYYNYTNIGSTTTATDMTLPLTIAPAATATSRVVSATGAVTVGQIPGGQKTNEYGVYGDIFKMTKQTGAGLARVGLWLEKADTHRSFYDLNLLGGITPNYDQAAVPGAIDGINNVLYEQKSGWKQYQPFAEFEWNVTPALKVTPGIKYMHTDLTIDALVNQTGRTQINLEKTFTKTLPFLTANYTIAPGLSTYAQYAQGMLVPNIGSFQSQSALLTNLSPQTSTNYQVGVVHQSDTLTFDADVYYIAFNNKIASLPGQPANAPIFFNQGAVTYKGVEAQATYVLPAGFSLYANGSINRATTDATGLEIAGVPKYTTALGLLFRSGGWGATLFHKQVGRVYALDNNGYALDPYSTTDLNVSYLMKNPGMGFKTVKMQLGIFNLLNKQSIIAASVRNNVAGTAAYGTPNAGDQFQWQTPRSMMASLRAEF